MCDNFGPRAQENEALFVDYGGSYWEKSGKVFKPSAIENPGSASLGFDIGHLTCFEYIKIMFGI